MSRIKNFSGIRFNPDKVSIENCIAPPYDVFNYGDNTDNMLRKYPYNIVHIQKPLGSGDSKYSNANRIFQNFLTEKILFKEENKGIYILQQKWNDSSRTGVIAIVKLDDSFSYIKPHEKTKPGPVTDRLKLTKSTDLNIGSIFVVFKDTDSSIINVIKKELSSCAPIYNFKFPSDIQNKLYFINDFDLTSLLENKTFYIADGHHRYQTMLGYRNHMRKKTDAEKGENNFEYTMMFMVPETEITIFPYHRLIRNVKTELIATMPDRIASKFSMKTYNDIFQPPDGSLGMYTEDTYYILTPEKTDPEILDVEVLQNDIFESCLNLGKEEIKTGHYIHYIPGNEDIKNIKELIKKKKYQIGFILNPLTFNDITHISDTKKTLPPKSTYFYPKVPSGIVLYSLI